MPCSSPARRRRRRRGSSPVKNSHRRARRGKIGGRLVFAPGAPGAKTSREPMLTKYGATRRLFNRAGRRPRASPVSWPPVEETPGQRSGIGYIIIICASQGYRSPREGVPGLAASAAAAGRVEDGGLGLPQKCLYRAYAASALASAFFRPSRQAKKALSPGPSFP